MKSLLVLASLVLANSALAAQPRAWSDQYGDVVVVNCGDGTIAEYRDPNKCGAAMAKGSMGCTEAATFTRRSKPVSADNGRVVLRKNEHAEVTLTAKAAGVVTYAETYVADSDFNTSEDLGTGSVNSTTIDSLCSVPLR